jgi:dTDP-4-dehydrorhamnose 3,5-epimerase
VIESNQQELAGFTRGKIHDVVVKPLKKFVDERGWLCELWREDQLDAQFIPVMTYVSQTEPGVVRGPHEHVGQADYFCFMGPGNFKLYLWDNRPDSPTYNVFQTFVVGQDSAASVIVPIGVVHAYKNVSSTVGVVINCPNALYAGRDYKEPVDEIRHEADPDSRFKVD